MGRKSELCASKLRYFQKFRKENEKWIKICYSESVENQRCSSLFQGKSALFSPESALFHRKLALIQRWFLALKIFVFSAVQSWISAVKRFSGNEQRWNRPEIILNQSWSALKIYVTSTRVCIKWSFLDINISETFRNGYFWWKKSFLKFYLVYKRFFFKIQRTIQQKLEMLIFEQFLNKFRVFLLFKGLNEKLFGQDSIVNVPLNSFKPLSLVFRNVSIFACIKLLFFFNELFWKFPISI